MAVVPNSLIPSADDLLGLTPFERRHPELEAGVEGVTGVDAYSLEQAQQLERLAPIKFCTLPEFYLYEASSEYIPKDYLEEDASYEVRKTRAQSNFEPFYSHLRDLIVGTALRKGINVPDNADQDWMRFFKDADLEGHSITSFCKELFTSAIDNGVAGIWVEYPKLSVDLTAEEEKRLNPRPYFVLMRCDQVLDCRNDIYSTEISGQSLFGSFPTYLRIKTEVRRQSESNEFFEESIPAVLVYDIVDAAGDESSELNDTIEVIPPGQTGPKVRCRTYLKLNSPAHTDVYTLEDTRFLSIPFIPFVPVFGGKKEAYFRARPLLLDIARLNLNHWAIAADLNESIHLTASPILTGTGVRPDDEVKAGSGRAMFSQNSDAKFNLMSASMEGAGVTLQNLQRIEKSMERLAAVAMTTSKTQAESGFAKLLDRSQSDSQLAVLVQSLEDGINRALLYASAYRGYEPITITISKNFVPVKLHSQQIMALIQLWREGVITISLFFQMLEAGEMFEGIPGFEVQNLLLQMGLTGEETAKVMQVGIFSGANAAAGAPSVEVDNRTPLSEGADREPAEGSIELPEA